MKNILAKTALVLALGIAPGAVLAQSNSGEGGAAAGAQTQGQAGTSGAAAGADAQAGQSGQAGQRDREEITQGQAGGAADTQVQGQAGGAADGAADTQAQGQADGAADGAADTQAQGEAESTTEGQASGEAGGTEMQAEGEAGTDRDTTAAIPDVDITAEQRTEIRQVIQSADVEPVDDIDFDLSVGIAVPSTIELYPLPPRIVEIVPVYEGYRYFILADGRIIIVEPDTLHIVYIIEA